MFGTRINLRNQAFQSVDNWGKILKTVILVSIVKSGIFTSSAQAQDFCTYDQDEELVKKQSLMSLNLKK